MTLAETGFLCRCRSLLHDRDAKFCAAFDAILESVGIQAVISNGDGSNSSASTRFISIIRIRIAAGFLFSGYGDRVLPF